jgi:aspartate 1-decarboxylase
MLRNMLKSKLHHARVTEADLHYVGSVTIDADLLRRADILPNEKVLVINNNNGARFETYAFEGEAGSGVVCMNGGCARHVHVGDTVIIAAFGLMDDREARTHRPRVLFLDADNRVTGGFPPEILPPGLTGALPTPPPATRAPRRRKP